MAVTDPVFPPLQRTLVAVVVTEIEAGAVKVTEVVEVHPFASVTNTL